MTIIDKKGFSAVEAVLIIMLVALIGFVGWYVYQQQSAVDSTDVQPPETQSQTVPEVNEASDLDAAQETLDNTNVEQELDTSTIDNAITQ